MSHRNDKVTESAAMLRVASRSGEIKAQESKLVSTLILARPSHWIKNGFVFLPLIFGGKLTDLHLLITGIIIFAAFCLGSSSVYAFNDLIDAEADRLHPVKRRRPIASGRLKVTDAIGIMMVWGVTAVAIGFWISVQVGALIVSYIALNVLYSLHIKHMVLLDVFCIAAGFLLRVMAGAFASTVPPSHWILLMTLFLALLLSLGKRKGELSTLTENSENHRRVLNSYSARTLDQMLVVLVGMVVVTFSLYAVSDYTIQRFGSDALVYTVPLVVYGLFRYLYVVNDRGSGGDPTEILFSDRPLLLSVVAWVIACVWIVYA